MMILKDLASEAAARMRQAADHMATGNDEAKVENLLERVSEGMQPSERRESMIELKDLLSSSPAALEPFAAMAAPVLCGVLRDDLDDVELVQATLECTLAAVGGAADDGPPTQIPDAIAILRQQTILALTQDSSMIHLLICLLETDAPAGEDFYVRFWTVQVLAQLAAAAPVAVQSAVMAQAQGVARLMDLLNNQDVMRAEALVLLTRLTERNEELQKIVAFEGAFDTLMGVIASEVYAHGGIVVKDCVLLMVNLLRGNAANQVMFRESGFVNNIHHLLEVARPDASGVSATAAAAEHWLAGGAPSSPTDVHSLATDVADNLVAATHLIPALLTPPSGVGREPGSASKAEFARQSIEANRAVLTKTPVTTALLKLALLPTSGSSWHESRIRVDALRALALLARGNQAAQDAIGNVALPDARGGGRPALQLILCSMLQAADAQEGACGALLFDALAVGNRDGQIAWTATAPPVVQRGTLGQESVFGELLLSALSQETGDKTGEGWRVVSRAACVLRALLHGNESAKARVLSIKVELRTGRFSKSKQVEAMVLTLQQLDRAASAMAAVAMPGRAGAGPPSDAPRSGSRPTSTTAGAAAGTAAAAAVAAPALACLLSVWAADCPAATAQIVRDPAYLATLIDMLHTGAGGDAVCSGLIAATLGCCVLHGQDSREGPASRLGMLDLLTNRVGLRNLYGALDGLIQADDFQAAHASKPFEEAGGDSSEDAPGPGGALSVMYSAILSPATCDLLHALVGRVKQTCMTLFSQPGPLTPASGAAARAGGATPAADVNQLQAQVQELSARNAALASQLAQQQQSRADSAGGAAPASDPEAVARAQLEASRLRDANDALRQQVETLQQTSARHAHEAAACREQLAETADYVHKLEADMRALSDAYTALEAELSSRDDELKRLRAITAAQGTSAQETTNSAHKGPSEAEEELERLQAEMEDLLVCLGQEEIKVELLSEKLREAGGDPDQVIAQVGVDESEDGEPDGRPPGAGVDVGQWLTQNGIAAGAGGPGAPDLT